MAVCDGVFAHINTLLLLFSHAHQKLNEAKYFLVVSRLNLSFCGTSNANKYKKEWKRGKKTWTKAVCVSPHFVQFLAGI